MSFFCQRTFLFIDFNYYFFFWKAILKMNSNSINKNPFTLEEFSKFEEIILKSPQDFVGCREEE